MKTMKKGFTLVELLVVIGILGILMGALFPAISSAMVKANLSAVSMKGRNLFVAITAANTEREAIGLGNCWPQDAQEGATADASDPIGSGQAGDIASYFKYLFDSDNFGTEKWKPYVSGVDIGVLSGASVPAAKDLSSITAKNVMWVVGKNVSDELDDVVPVLVSKNVTVSDLAKDYTAGGGEELTLTSAMPFGNKAFVAVRKGGAVVSQTAKYATKDILYNRQSFKLPTGEGVNAFTYLEQ